MQPSSLKLRLKNQLLELDEVNARVAGFAEANQLHPKTVFVLDLVIEEMLTNAIKYGFDDSGVHEIRLEIDLQPPSIRVRIEDDGHEFDPRKAPPPAQGVPLQEMKIGGLGIHLVRKMATYMDYRRENGRNILELFIPFEPALNASSSE